MIAIGNRVCRHADIMALPGVFTALGDALTIALFAILLLREAVPGAGGGAL